MRYAVIILYLCISQVSQGQSVISDSLLNLASHEDQHGSAVSAFMYIDKCIDTDSLAYDCYMLGAKIAQKQGDFRKVKEYLLHDSLIHYRANECHQILANIYEQEGNTAKSGKYYKLLCESFPDRALYHRKLAQQYARSGAVNSAFQEYAIAYRLNDKDVFTIIGLSEFLAKAKEYEKLDSILNAAVAYDSTNVRIKLQLASSKYRQQQYDSTCIVMRSLQGRIDFNQYYNKMYGYSLIQIDSLDDAIFYLEKSLQGDGNPEKAHYYLGIAYEKKDEHDNAKYHFRKAIEYAISKDIDLYHRNLAAIANSDNDDAEEIKHLKKVYEYEPTGRNLFQLARAADEYYADKNIAKRYYQKYLKLTEQETQLSTYARDRVAAIKEYLHFQKKSKSGL